MAAQSTAVATIVVFFQKLAGVQVTKEQFRDCYVYAERELAKTRHILPEHNFYDLLLIKMRIEIGNLVENAVLPSDYPVEEKALAVARYCYNRAKESVEEARFSEYFLLSCFQICLADQNPRVKSTAIFLNAKLFLNK